MKLIKSESLSVCTSNSQIIIHLIPALCLFIFLVGCGDQVHLPSPGQLVEFNNAGPVCPSLDIERLVKAEIGSGPYRVVPGDVLELTMPAIIRFVTAEEAGGIESIAPYLCRINESGTIMLPIVGDVKVAGRTLSQIESSIIDAYCPEYVVTRPSVFARVLEYKTAKVSITGAVERAGIYSLRSDQMSLVALLMEAGGIIDEGAAVIRIVHRSPVVPNNAQDSIPDAAKEVFGRSAEIGRTGWNKPSNDDHASRGIDVRLAFRESATSRTVGILTITHGQTILLAEPLNIANQDERLYLLEKLEQKEPRISTANVDEKLGMLAAQLNHNQSVYSYESESQNGKRSSNVESGRNQSERVDRAKMVSRQKPKVSTVEVEQGLWLPVNPIQYSHAMPRGAIAGVNGNTNRNEGAFTNYLSANMDADELFDKKAVEILNQDRSPGNMRITESGGAQGPEAFVLPIKGLNIPFTDVVLQDGDSVIVERLQPPLFSVVGLVNSPGNFPYPPDAQYNLMQALAFAGGLDRTTEPRYATIYRLKPDNTIVRAIFEVVNIGNGSRLTEALNTRIKVGDIIAVEHTPRTRTKLFLDTIFRINIGTYWRLNNAWEE